MFCTVQYKSHTCAFNVRYPPYTVQELEQTPKIVLEQSAVFWFSFSNHNCLQGQAA